MEFIDEKIDEYFNWMKKKYSLKKHDKFAEITTPFKNHLNDYIRIYVEQKNKDKLILSDDGQTLNELEMMGIDINSKTRKHLLSDILLQFGLTREDDQILFIGDSNNFAQAKHNLIQGILKIYDISLTARKNVKSLFYEEVLEYLFENNIQGSENIHLTGESGISYTVDYIVPATKKRPEIIVNFSNNLDFNKVAADAFLYRDLKDFRKSRNNRKSEMNIIVNDVENKISDKVYQAAKHEGIKILKWSDKANVKKELTRV